MDSGVLARLTVALPIALGAVLALDLTGRSLFQLHAGIEKASHGALLILAFCSAAASIALMREKRAAGRNKPGAGSGNGLSGDPTLPFIFHEIKNYALTMKGNATLLRSQIAGGNGHPSLERLERATERIEKLSREVIDITLMGKPSDAQAVELVGLVKSTAEGYFQAFDLSFSIKADKAGFTILGEARKLEQVFLNLFKNAVEAGARRIDVTLVGQPGKVGLLIEDDGKGCTPEQVETMFDAYQSYKRSQGGTGLGLFLVKAIVEGHHGSISGFSKNQKAQGGNGMVFVLRFPLAEENRQAPSVH